MGTNTGLRVPVRVLGLDLSFLCDTGAECTIISTQIWDQIPEESRPVLRPGRALKTVGDHHIPIRGSTHLNLEVSGRPVCCQVEIADIADMAVLGLDVLSTLRVQIDCGKGTLEWPDMHESDSLARSGDVHD